MSAVAIGQWEQRLARENLAPLDYDDGAGGIKVGNRGSGKLLDASRAFARASAVQERDRRAAVLTSQRFAGGKDWRHGQRNPPVSRADRRIYALYASGLSFGKIARRVGKNKAAIFRIITRVERQHARAPEERMGELLGACEPKTIVLFFWLLERALTEPEKVREMIGKLRAVPELRALIEPDDGSPLVSAQDGGRRLGPLSPGGANGIGDGTGDGRYAGTWGEGGRVGDATRRRRRDG